MLRPQRDSYWRLIPHLQGASSRAVTVLGRDGCVRYQSALVEQLLGYRPEDFVGKPLTEFLCSCACGAAEEAMTRMVERRQRFALWRFCFQDARKRRHWLEGKATNFIDDPRLNGIIVYWNPLLL